MSDIHEILRQMLAVLQAERQALAGLNMQAILAAAADKRDLCGRLDTGVYPDIDDECRGMLDAARRLNDINRQLRNLIAANVSARLEALTGTPTLYRVAPGHKARR